MPHAHRRHHSKYVTERELKSLIGSPERKWFNTISPATAINNTGTIYKLDSTVQGTGDNNRIGDTISVHSILTRFIVTTVGATAPVDTTIRLIWFRWLQATPPVPINVLEFLGPQGVLQPINKNYGKSIIVISEKLITLTPNNQSTVSRKKFHQSRFQIEYDTTTTSTTNGVWLLALSDQSLSSQMPYLQFVTRLTFTDV